MNDEKEVKKLAKDITEEFPTGQDDNLMKSIASALLSHGKSCYERGVADAHKFDEPREMHNAADVDEITRLKERVTELEAKLDKNWKIEQESLEKLGGVINDLEAKLKEALLVGYDCGHEKQDVIGGDCVHCNLVVAEGSVLSLQKRLSQAEAEKEDFEVEGVSMDIDMSKKYSDLLGKYSHLMDVAGKMAGALEKMCSDEFDYSHREGEVAYGLRCIAKDALAEWDGIKDGGK